MSNKEASAAVIITIPPVSIPCHIIWTYLCEATAGMVDSLLQACSGWTQLVAKVPGSVPSTLGARKYDYVLLFPFLKVVYPVGLMNVSPEPMMEPCWH